LNREIDAAPDRNLPIAAAGDAPETYLLDGLQYVLATGGDQLFAFVLNP